MPTREERFARMAAYPLLPLRTGLDYRSAGRKTFLVDGIGSCKSCGGSYISSETKTGHTPEECEAFTASSVLES